MEGPTIVSPAHLLFTPPFQPAQVPGSGRVELGGRPDQEPGGPEPAGGADTPPCRSIVSRVDTLDTAALVVYRSSYAAELLDLGHRAGEAHTRPGWPPRG